MGKDDEPSLAEEIASVLEAVAEDTGSATLSVTVRSFVDPSKESGSSSSVGGDVHGSAAFKGIVVPPPPPTSAGWYGGSPPCGTGKACSGDVMHDIWGYNVGPAEICPCGRHLAEGMRIFKLRKEVVAWVCSSSNGVPHHVAPSSTSSNHFTTHPHHPPLPPHHAQTYGGAPVPGFSHPPASPASPLHHGVVGG
ncbi:hypothetical protein HDU67_005958, partial [Dinochytrium kinnereticum]